MENHTSVDAINLVHLLAAAMLVASWVSQSQLQKFDKPAGKLLGAPFIWI